MELETQLNILKELRIPYKASLVRILWQIFSEHQEEIKDLDKDVISKIFPPRKEGTPQQKWQQRARPSQVVHKIPTTMKLCKNCNTCYPKTDAMCPSCGKQEYDMVILQ